MKNLIILTVVALFTFVACENSTTAETAKADVAKAGESVKELFNKESMRLKSDIEKAQEKIDERIKELNIKWVDASEELKADIDQEKKELKYNRTKLADDLDRLGEDIGDGWEEFKKNVNKTLQEVDKEINEEL